MNHGFFGFPAKLNPSENAIKTFDTSGAYTILPGTKKLYIFAIGGGGGGGAGGRSANPAGGGGGSGGGFVLQQFLVSDLGGPGQTLLLSVGASGTGGTAPTTDNTAGNPGDPGGDTSIQIAGKPGILVYCQGGAGGAGGGTASGVNAAGGTGRACQIDTLQQTGLAGANSGFSIVVYNMFAHSGAGGANRYVTNNTGSNISIEGFSTTALILPPYRTGGQTLYSGGTADSSTPPPDSNQQIYGLFSPGFGAASGGSGITAAARGGHGFRGSGGGGGGGGVNGIVPGAGGNGGKGYVAIRAIY